MDLLFLRTSTELTGGGAGKRFAFRNLGTANGGAGGILPAATLALTLFESEVGVSARPAGWRAKQVRLATNAVVTVFMVDAHQVEIAPGFTLMSLMMHAGANFGKPHPPPRLKN